MTAQTFNLPEHMFDPEPVKTGIEAFYNFAPVNNKLAMVPFGVASAATGMATFGAVPAFGFWFGLCKAGANSAMQGFTSASEGKPAEMKVAAKSVEAPKAPAEAVSFAEMAGKPAGLTAPKAGKADDLKLISGVGPKIEGILHELGIFHFDQIAMWSPEEVIWVDDHLKFSGRITREDWIAQARALAKGGRDEYVKVFGKEPV